MQENQNPPPTTSNNPPSENPPLSPVMTTSDPGSNSTSPVKPASKFSIKAIISTIIFLLLAGGAAAGYVYREPIMQIVSKPTPTPSPIVTITPTPDPTADWKTYNKLGISFQYPSEWSRTEEDDAFWVVQLIPNNVATNHALAVKEYQINIHLRENTDNLSAQEVWNERVKEGVRNPVSTEITINGHKGVRVSNNALDSHDTQYIFANEETIVYFSLNYYIDNYEQAIKKYPNAENELLQILSTFKFTPDNSPAMSGFKSRFYNLTDYLIQPHKFPTAMTDIPDSELIEMSCSSYYAGYDGEYISNGDTNHKLSDPKLLEILKQYEAEAGYYCLTKDNKTIVEYEKWGGGGGGANVAYISVLDKDDQLTEIASIPNDGVPYFNCRTIMQLSATNDLYLRCGGGDGGSGGSSIYKINLVKKTSEPLLICQTVYDEKNQESNIECRNQL